MRLTPLVLGSLLAATALSAHAVYTTVSYTGTVSRVFAATSGPTGPADIVVGTPVTFSATFDTAKFVDFTPNLTDQATGAPLLLPTKGATLFGDPGASYTITIASHVFTLADDDYGGSVNPANGVGPFPFVAYSGNQLMGIEGDADLGGLHFSSTPADYLLQASAHVGYGYFDADGDYGFRVDTSLDPALVALRLQGLAFAAAVPEPSSWAMLLVGVGVVAAAAAAARGRRTANSPAPVAA